MEDKEIIEKIKELKAVKPTKEWAFWLKSNILEKGKQEELVRKPQFKLVSWRFVSRYSKVWIPSLLAVFFVFSFAYAQFTLPGNIFYPLKTVAQNARIYLAPANQKPVVRLEIAKARLNDLMKVRNHQQAVALVIQNTQENLKNVPEDIKNIPSKKLSLLVSQRAQNNYQDISQMVKKTNLSSTEKAKLNQAIKDSQKEVLTYAMNTSEELNQCPSSLESQLVELSAYFNTPEVFHNWSIEDISKVKSLLTKVSDDLKKGECLKAKDKMESIHQLLLIHPASNPVEDTTTTLPSSD